MGSKEKRKRMKAEKAAGERAAQKKAAGRTGGRRTGYILLAAGALLIIAGLYLFSRTWGVNLLFTAVWLGRISRFYWAVILIGAGLAVLGAAALKKSPAAGAKGAAPEPAPEAAMTEPEREAAKEELAAARQEEEAAKTVQKETEKEVEKEAEKGAGRVCPVCGNRLSARSRFCGKCGTKIE